MPRKPTPGDHRPDGLVGYAESTPTGLGLTPLRIQHDMNAAPPSALASSAAILDMPLVLREGLPMAAYACDADGRIRWFNRRAASLWGREPLIQDGRELYCGAYQLLDLDGSSFAHDKQPMAQVLRTGTGNHEQEVIVQRQDGTRAVALLQIEPVFDEGQVLIGAICCCTETTARYQTLQALHENQRTPSELLQALPAAIYTTDAKGYITSFNAAAVALWGWEPVIGSSQWCGAWRLLWPDGTHLPHEECPMAITLKEGRPLRGIEAMAERRDGSRVPFLAYPSPIWDEHGTLIGAVNMLVDYTAQKHSERRLRDEANINETLSHISEMLVTELALPKIAQLVTDGATKLIAAQFGAFFYNAQDGQGERYMMYAISGEVHEVASPFTVAPDTDMLRRLFQGHGAVRVDDLTQVPGYKESVLGHAAQTIKSHLAVPVISNSGEFLGALLFGHSLAGVFTERHEQLIGGVANQAAIAIDNARLYTRLQEVAERLSLALSAAKLGDWSWMVESDLVTFSENAARIFGITAEPLKPWSEMVDMIHAEDREQVIQAIGQAVITRQPTSIECRIARPDGRSVWVSAWGMANSHVDGANQGLFGVIQDISERKQMEEELRKRASALADTDKRKDEFLATLAHELRNPLAPLRTSLEVLQRKDCTEAQYVAARAVMSRQVAQMAILIDELLDVSRISSGKVILRRENIGLQAIIDHALEMTLPLITEYGHRISVNIPAAPVYLHADKTRLAQTLSNLLNNAAKYTPKGGDIWLDATVDGHDIVINIRDSGIGIASEMLERVFDVFLQIDRNFEQAEGGLGIGLSLAKRLTALHGGSLTAHSEGLGKGSLFTLRLPLLANLEAPMHDTLPISAEHGASTARRILVVDDNVDCLESMAMLLELEGHEVLRAQDGLDAYRIAMQKRPDIVFMDIGLPKLNGYETAQKLREDYGSQALTLVAISGWGQDKDRTLSLQAGFDFHLVKPVDFSALTMVINEGRPGA
ncbi:PAS domain S-box protein [Chitinimonas arctica]|uniref:histidine kinase n=1 Tax=Chitinimonas arctica TaxID=2594795 RepID=A0A516SA88_9NEIS|nr:PAS domain S-box protein [Chitinimonas arctica]QDQ25052.1 PAS domain S-box protein [Chitinimonas arctica]